MQVARPFKLAVNSGDISSAFIVAPGSPFAAHRLRDYWVVGSRQESGRVFLSGARFGKSQPTAAESDWLARLPSGLSEFHLGGTDVELLLSELNPPFGAIALRPDGTVLRGAVPGAGEGNLDSEGALGRWVAMPVLPLDDGYIQTIADLHGDTRRLILRDARGRVVREIQIDAAMAFVASDVRRRLLYAYRRVPVGMIVVYHWSRVNTGASS